MVADASADELPALIGRLEAAKAAAWARLTVQTLPSRNDRPDADRNLSVEQAAHRLGVSKDYLYRHAERFPFTLRIGRRLLFSARGLDKWTAQKQRP
jgi:excisionase family DNA binding protein